jgi:hypothetical protein
MVNKTFSIILTIFLLVILGATFADVISDNLFDSTGTFSVTDKAYTSSVTANGTVEIDGKILLSDSVTVERGGVDITENFTSSRVGDDLFLVTSDDAVAADQNGTAVNLTYSYGGDNYIEQQSSRTIINLVILFFVIGLLIYIAGPVMRNFNSIADKFKR